MITGKEPKNLPRFIGLLIGFYGAAFFLFGSNGDQIDSEHLEGDFYFFLSAIFWGVYSILSKHLIAKYNQNPLCATTWSIAGGTLLLVLFGLESLSILNWSSIEPIIWCHIIYSAIGPTALAFFLYSYALRFVSASTATAMMFTVPVFGSFFSTVFLGETLQHHQLVGSGFMLLGSIIATQTRLFKHFNATKFLLTSKH